jgi:hypothetical protein
VGFRGRASNFAITSSGFSISNASYFVTKFGTMSKIKGSNKFENPLVREILETIDRKACSNAIEKSLVQYRNYLGNTYFLTVNITALKGQQYISEGQRPGVIFANRSPKAL